MFSGPSEALSLASTGQYHDESLPLDRSSSVGLEGLGGWGGSGEADIFSDSLVAGYPHSRYSVDAFADLAAPSLSTTEHQLDGFTSSLLLPLSQTSLAPVVHSDAPDSPVANLPLTWQAPLSATDDAVTSWQAPHWITLDDPLENAWPDLAVPVPEGWLGTRQAEFGLLGTCDIGLEHTSTTALLDPVGPYGATQYLSSSSSDPIGSDGQLSPGMAGSSSTASDSGPSLQPGSSPSTGGTEASPRSGLHTCSVCLVVCDTRTQLL